ncbi:arabinofuranosyltransferase, partial [Mycobacterium sp. E1715]|uniref:arabinofuranosyltransferase n=1 Tax=Mycobacterium sp. E1715 TaxID=1856863 RepID=UPI003515C13E
MRTASTKPNAPAATSSTVRVGCSRNDSSVVRARSSVRASALGIGVLAIYLWSLLSMLTTLARTTLLSFRLQPTLTVLLVAAGAFG